MVQTLSTGVPALVKRIGLPWPVAGSLTVTEVSSALLEGYAGFYSPEKHAITISEDLDPLVIVHEAARNCGVGAEIAATIAERAHYELEAPIQRVTGYDVVVPLARLEHDNIPSVARILDAVRQTLHATH